MIPKKQTARWGALLVATLLGAAGLVSFGAIAQDSGNVPEAAPAVMDRPTARTNWKAQWYDEAGQQPVITGKSKQRSSQGGPGDAEFRRRMLEAAAKEKQKWGDMIPGVKGQGSMSEAASPSTSGTATAPTILAAATGTTWSNLGPTKADVAQNGGTSLAKTDAGRVSAIVIDPADVNKIYAGFSGGGVWKTINGGSSWTPITESIGSLSVGALTMDPGNSNTLYLGLGDPFDGTGIGMMKSTDAGTTWTGPVYLGTSTVINDIKVAPGGSVVLAATNEGVFRSTNAGASWTAVTLATGQTVKPYAWSIGWTGGTNFVVSVEANKNATTGTTDGQIHRTADSGATWTKATGFTATTGVGRTSLGVGASTRTNPAAAVLYALAGVPNAASAADFAGIFKSTNGGASWTRVGAPTKTYTNSNTESNDLGSLLGGQGGYNQLVVVDPSNASVAYFGGQLLLARTADGGLTYTQKTNWLGQFSLTYVHADFHAAAMQGTTLIVGSDGGLFKSTNAGTTFTDALNVGITSHLIYSVGSSPAYPNSIIGGFQDNGTRVRSSVTPTTFNQYIGGDGFGSLIHPTNGLMLGSLYYTRIYKSTTATGNVFNAANSGIAESNNQTAAPFNTGIVPWTGDSGGNTVFTWVNAKVYKSTNFAGSWAALGTSGLPTSSFVIRGVGVAPSNINVIGLVASGGRVFQTTNGGTSWALAGTLPNNNLSLSKVIYDPVNPSILYVASAASTATASHLWKSVNAGATFTAIDSGGFPAGVPVNTVRVDPGNTSVLYAGTHLGIYRSTNGGTNWARFGSGLPLVNVEDIYISPTSSIVRIATFGRGFWQLN